MSQPKKKTSKQRRDTRRYNSHRKKHPTPHTLCSETGKIIKSHSYTFEGALARSSGANTSAS